MSYDLCLGFKEKPRDLDSVLASQGFKHNDTPEPTNQFKIRKMKSYWHDDGVDFTYHDYGDEQWEELHSISGIVAQGTISSSGSGNGRGRQRQKQIGKFLRDYYKAILENPQTGRLVKD